MTTQEKEIWAKVINDARWYDGTPQMLNQLTEHFEKQGIVVKNCSIPDVSDWVAVSEQLPEVGVEVWAVTYNDEKVRKIVWGTGDEAFYEYWKVLNRPEPPCR